MTPPMRLLAVVLLVGAPAGFHGAARAAESYDNCTGFIDSLPAVISTQGNWCLRGHKYSSLTTGAAITISADNVTIDCNDYRVSGYGAGAATEAVGVTAGASRLNATIRNCRIQGFKRGAAMYGAGHRIEDNRFEGNTFSGIYADGPNIQIRNNLVLDTGGKTGSLAAWGITAVGMGSEVIGNTVQGVNPGHATDKRPRGIFADAGVLVRGNRIGGLVQAGGISALGIWVINSIARDNVLLAPLSPYNPAIGIYGGGASNSMCRGNTIKWYPTAVAECLSMENVVQAAPPPAGDGAP